uniref:Secreted protein n=1 Tax=Caenorhabditis tropicalis TaxID=1561998 RepID=A0A1I7T4X5_9PELO
MGYVSVPGRLVLVLLAVRFLNDRYGLLGCPDLDGYESRKEEEEEEDEEFILPEHKICLSFSSDRPVSMVVET